MIRCPQCGASYPSESETCSRCGFKPPRIDGLLAWAPALAHAGGGFKPEYFSDLAAREAGNFWFRSRNALILWALGKYFPQMRSFMELGCGTGYVLSGIATAFPIAAITGSEVFTEGLSFAAGRVPRATLVQMDGRSIPYEADFDVVGAFDVIEHIREDGEVLSAMARALKPGGGLVLTVPQHPWLWSAADEYACHQRRYTATDLHAKIGAAGFEILRSTSFVSTLLPVMLASRRRGREGKPFDPVDEFRIGPVANRTLEAVLRLELAAIRFGLSFPLGGSRLVVARKREQR